MVPMPQIPEGLASLPRCSIRVDPCHPWLVNPVHERGWTTDLTDGHGSEARELSADGADGGDFQGCGWGSGTGRLSTDFTDDTDSGPRFQIRGRYLLRVPPPGLPMPSRLPDEGCLPGIQRASGTTSGSFAPVLTLPLLLGASAGMLLIPLPALRASEGALPIPCRTVPRGEPASSRRQDTSRIQQWIVAIRGRNPSPWP